MIRIQANKPHPYLLLGSSRLSGKAGSITGNQYVTSSPPPHPLYKSYITPKDSLSWLLAIFAIWGTSVQGVPGHLASGHLAFATLVLATLAFAFPLELSANNLCLHASRVADL